MPLSDVTIFKMNFENTHHALVYPNSDVTNKKSSIIFKKYIISTGTLLTNLILSNKLQTNVENHLTKKKLIIAGNDELWKDLEKETFVVIHDSDGDLIRRKARLKYFFNSQNIFESVKEILSGFQSYKMPFDQINFHQLLVSSFVIFEFCDIKTNGSAADESLVDAIVEDVNGNERLNKLDPVVSVTTPFAHESFFKTVNVSKVANIFGSNDSLLIIAAPLVYGCEGGAVYNSAK